MNEDQNIQDSLAEKVEVKKTLRKLANTPNDPNMTIVESFDWPITVQPPQPCLENSLKDKSPVVNSPVKKIDWLKEKDLRRAMCRQLLLTRSLRRIV